MKICEEKAKGGENWENLIPGKQKGAVKKSIKIVQMREG
jgi:hypothetical protein